MDRNVLLATILSMAVLFAYMSWQSAMTAEQAKRQQETEALTAAEAEARGEALPTFGEPSEGAGDSSASGGSAAAPSPPSRPSPAPTTAEGPSAGAVAEVEPWTGTVENENVIATLSNAGGGLIGWRLKDYPERTGTGEIPVEFIDSDHPALLTPLEGLGFGDLSGARYEVVSQSRRRVEMVLRRGGVEVRRTFTLPDTGYEFGLELAFIGTGSGPISMPSFDVRWPAAVNTRPDFRELAMLVLAEDEITRTPVPGVGRPGFFSRFMGGGDEGPTIYAKDVEWAGVDLRYFVGVLFDGESAPFSVHFEAVEPGEVAEAIFDFGPTDVTPGITRVRQVEGFIGPKKAETLADAGRDLDRSVNRGYSWVEPLTHLFEIALGWLYVVTRNYGVAIIVLTILVRLAASPIMVKQMKSMERMREVQPKLKEIQEKYKDDRQKQSEEMMRLYREEGVNPLGGCFPMLLQFPVFIGLYFALQSSFELRHAPFVFWIDDLSVPATLFTIPGLDFPVRLLPLIMGASMFFQQKMTPATGVDPAQQKMMLVMMPGMMLFISYTFPSGLVLYWTVSNLLGIGHQLWVRRNMQAAAS